MSDEQLIDEVVELRARVVGLEAEVTELRGGWLCERMTSETFCRAFADERAKGRILELEAEREHVYAAVALLVRSGGVDWTKLGEATGDVAEQLGCVLAGEPHKAPILCEGCGERSSSKDWARVCPACGTDQRGDCYVVIKDGGIEDELVSARYRIMELETENVRLTANRDALTGRGVDAGDPGWFRAHRAMALSTIGDVHRHTGIPLVRLFEIDRNIGDPISVDESAKIDEWINCLCLGSDSSLDRDAGVDDDVDY